MNLASIKARLEEQSIHFSNDRIFDHDSVIGYEKKFRWAWMATQLNTFIIVSDYGDQEVTVSDIEAHLNSSFDYAKANYNGWPRGLQSGLGVITVLLSTNLSQEAIDYCKELKSGKKWAGFTIPVVINTESNTLYAFDKKPMWGRIYYPHFEQLINGLK
jgi:hypothetical protein